MSGSKTEPNMLGCEFPKACKLCMLTCYSDLSEEVLQGKATSL